MPDFTKDLRDLQGTFLHEKPKYFLNVWHVDVIHLAIMFCKCYKYVYGGYMKIKNKLKMIGARVTEEQYKTIVKEASNRGQRVSEFIRERLLWPSK